MKTALLTIGLSLFFAGAMLNAQEKPRIIFDTDITGDVDDVLALAMCHAMADRGACDLLAVTISKVNPLTGPFTDAANTFYGRPDLPIGITRKAQIRDSRYLKLVEQKDGGQPRYPHDLLKNEDAPEAVAMLRKVLAKQPDHSVSIISVGLAVNVARLLETKGDEHSSLTGLELVKQKVRLLSIMAGAFQTIESSNRFLEANVKNDIGSMKTLADNWPQDVPVIWSGYEIGIATAYPRQSIAKDFNYLPHHIVKEAYLLYCGPDHDRPSWDLTSVLYAVFPERGYFDLSEPGTVKVHDDGFTQFIPGKKGSGNSRYMKLAAPQAERVREALVQFVSQPPHSNPAALK